MDVILLDDIQNLGKVGEPVRVKGGYGRNFLIPQGKAVPATQENLAKFEAHRAELEAKVKEEIKQAESIAKKLEKLKIVIKAPAGEEGQLFGSIGPREVSEAIVAGGVEITKKHIQMPEGPIRAIGEYEVGVQVHADVKMTLNIKVEGEKVETSA